MRHLVSLLVVLLLAAAPALAADRVLLSPHSAADQAQVLAGLRTEAGAHGTVRVIVGLRVPFAAEGTLPASGQAAQRSDIAAAAAELRGRFADVFARNGDHARSYQSLPFLALQVTAAELDRLAADPAVLSLTPDQRNSVQLAQSAPLIHAPEAWAAGFTGRGQTVAVLDTGIDKAHPFLAGKVVSEACFTWSNCPGRTSVAIGRDTGLPCPGDAACGHGTHIAGIVAGKGASFSGIAPDATLISVRVFTKDMFGVGAWDSDVILGLDHLMSLRKSFNIAAANLSLGRGGFRGPCAAELPAMTAVVANLRSAGIAVIAASGNGGALNAVSFPGCVPGVVSVGSVSDTAEGSCKGSPNAVDKVVCSSNTAPFLSLLAPGSAITSSIPGGGFATYGGTSMATAHVSGAWAVVKQKMASATPDQVLDAMQASGVPIADYRAPGIVKPRIDVAGAAARFVTLNLQRDGTGLGTMTAVTANGTTSCLQPCRVTLPQGGSVTISAHAASSSSFAAWSGPCASSTGDCTVRLASDTAITATFTGTTSPLSYSPLLVNGASDGGAVRIATTTGSYDCNALCDVPVEPLSQVTVSVRPAENAKFQGWSGLCSGTAASCSFQQPAGPAELHAGFSPAVRLNYVRSGSGTGSVSFSPAGNVGATCNDSCSQGFTPGTTVTLTPKAAPRSAFKGWVGACRGRRICTLTLTQALTVTARFGTR